MDAVGGYAYVGADDAFFVLARDGTMLSWLSLPAKPHDVLVWDGIAYLLASISEVSELYRIDVRNLCQPKLVEIRQIKEADGYAMVQWLDPAAALWFMAAHRFSDPLSEFNSGKFYLHLFSLGGGKVEVRRLWARPGVGDVVSRMFRGERVEPEMSVWPIGSILWRVTKTVPAWGLLHNVPEMKLVRLGTANDPAAIAAEWTLPEKSPRFVRTGLAYAGNRLFVAIEHTLYVLDAAKEGPPVVLARVTLPEPPVEIVVRRFQQRKVK